MQEFLKLCAQDILTKRKSDLSEICIVFPNKRPILFFKEYIAQNISQSIFLPQFSTIEDLFIDNNESVIPENILLVYELYKIYSKHTKSTEAFDLFYPWGELLLKDFNDIDKYLIDASQLFLNISSMKEYEDSFDFLSEEQIDHIQRFWDILSVKSQSEEKTNFLKVWQVLHDIYSDYKLILASQNFAYAGMASRNLIELLKSGGELIQSKKHYIFIGFNALNKCETELFSILKDRKQASFYWDYDISYTQSNFTHEAGYFVKKNIELFGNEIHESEFNNFYTNKKINIISAPNNIAQVKQTNNWINKHNTNKHTASETAIVLADEQLLVPVLNSIPEDTSYNISLGYPIKTTPAFLLFSAILNLHKNQKNGAFHYKDITQICENPLLPKDVKVQAQVLRKKIAKHNYIYVSAKQCNETYNLAPFTIIKKTPKEFIQHLEDCITETGKRSETSDLDKSVLYSILQSVQQIKILIAEYNIPVEGVSFLASLLKKALNTATIPIQGEPLKGLQIVGILETRTLDFKNLLILSMNEGLFPKTNVGSSFIPYSMRTGFGMPTIKEQTAIYSYYFYRLIQRAENVTLAYSAQVDENSKGEMSRYIMQLKYDSPADFMKNISEAEIGFSIKPKIANSISISKDKETEEYLENFISGEKTLSPSAINTYINCPLSYYFRYIRGLRKIDELQELPDERDYGNFLHYSLEDIYKPYLNNIITTEIITSILSNKKGLLEKITVSIQRALSEDSATGSVNSGLIELAKNTVLKYVENTLLFDKAKAPFTILGLEKKVKLNYPIANKNIWLGGEIDRLDNINDVYTIIDYKSATIKNTANSIEELFDTTATKRNNAVFQALLYSHIISELEHTDPEPQLYFTRQLHLTKSAAIILAKKPLKRYSEVKDEYSEALTSKLNDLFNLSLDFTQTEVVDNCKYCDFNKICNNQDSK